MVALAATVDPGFRFICRPGLPYDKERLGVTAFGAHHTSLGQSGGILLDDRRDLVLGISHDDLGRGAEALLGTALVANVLSITGKHHRTTRRTKHAFSLYGSGIE